MNIQNLDLNLLRVFEALLVEGSTTKAASRLHLTQSAVSAALARLRKALGDPLFVRTGHAMKPTVRALAIAQPICASLAAIARTLEESTVFEPADATRVFRIATTDHALMVLLPGLLRRIQSMAPGVRLEISSVSPDRGFEQVRDGSVDVLLAYFVTGIPEAMRSRYLFNERLTVLVAAHHSLAREDLTAQAYAAAQHLVVAPRGAWIPGPVDRALGALGLRRNVRVTVPNYLVAPLVAAEADLVATIPRQIAIRMGHGLGLVQLPPPVELGDFEVWLAWDDRHHHDVGHRWLRTAIAEVAATVAPWPRSLAAHDGRGARAPSGPAATHIVYDENQ